MTDFNCGHPRTPENSTAGYLHPNGKRYPSCAFCIRVKRIVRKVKRDQERINAGMILGSNQAAAAWL